MLIELKKFCLITSVDFIYFTLYEASFFNRSLLSISKMAEKRVHKKIKVLENNLTYFDDLSYHILSLKVEILS